MKLKDIFNYRKLWKHQKNKNKRLKKKVNKLSTSLAEELKLDVTNDEIRKLKQQVKALNNQVKKLNLEAQKYFDLFMENESESKGDD
jgi:ubiquinone biosynthesis protein UbiJ